MSCLRDTAVIQMKPQFKERNQTWPTIQKDKLDKFVIQSFN